MLTLYINFSPLFGLALNGDITFPLGMRLLFFAFSVSGARFFFNVVMSSETLEPYLKS